MHSTKRSVRNLQRMNYSPTEIARALGLTRARVYQLLAELKAKPNQVKRTLPTGPR
jgi:DNA-binding CsgD family transcriptional regulator